MAMLDWKTIKRYKKLLKEERDSLTRAKENKEPYEYSIVITGEDLKKSIRGAYVYDAKIAELKRIEKEIWKQKILTELSKN